MRQENKKRASRGRRKGRSRYMQQIAVLLVTVLLAGRIAPVTVAMAQLPSAEHESNVASPSGMTATDADWPEDEPESEESGDSADVVAGEENVATPSQQPRRMSARAEDGIIKIEAAKYYGNNTNDSGAEFGRYADLQPNTSIDIPLNADEIKEKGFTDGDYRIHIRQGGNSQTLTIKAGGQTGRIVCRDTAFGWTGDSETESLSVMTLSSSDTLSLEATMSDRYAHVDWIGLEKTEKSKQAWFEAKDYADSAYLTGDDTCIDMKEGRTVEIPLGNDFVRGIYSVLMVTTGNEREFNIQINDKDAGKYRVTGTNDSNPWQLHFLHEDGWQENLELKPGDKVTIISPTDNYGWLRDIAFKWVSEPDPDYLIKDGAYVFEAEKYYGGNTTAGGAAADLQPGESIKIALANVTPAIAPGRYQVQTTYAFNGQIMQVKAGNATSEIICPPAGGDLSGSKTAESLDAFDFTGNEEIILTAEAEKSGGGPWTWVDKISLVPAAEVKIRTDEKSFSGVAAADIVTGGCVNMTAGKAVTVTLDERFSEGTYGLQFFHSGDARSYAVSVNGQPAGTYDVPESKKNGAPETTHLVSDGWRGNYGLKAGDTVTITAPNDSSTGWIKGVTWKWLAGPGFAMEGDAYVFEGERYFERHPSDTSNPDISGADLHSGEALEIPLTNVTGFRPGNYLVQVVHAGNGQIMPLEAGSNSGEVIFAPADFNWGSSKTAECMNIFSLTGQETIRLRAVTDDKYTWIDKLRLVPVTENRIALTMADPIVELEKTTGDNGNCADMNPGRKLTMRLDGRFVNAQYALLLYNAGNARTYTVLVNGEEAGAYSAAGNGGFGTDQLMDNGWQERYELKAGDVVEIVAPSGSEGWIKTVVWKELPFAYYKKDAETGIVVEAEEGIIPAETSLTVKALGKVGQEYFSDRDLRAVGYRVELKYNGQLLDLTTEEREGKVQVTIPLPAGVDKENEHVDLYYMTGDEGEQLFAPFDENGRLTATMQNCGVYAVSMEKGIYHYEAEEYYQAWSDNGNAANFEVKNGNTISIPLRKEDGFDRDVYNLLIRYCGGNDGKTLTVNVNGKAAGQVRVDYTDWEQYRLVPAEGVLELYATNELALVTPEGQYHWIDYLELVEAEPFEASKIDGDLGIWVEAAIGALTYGTRLVIEEPESEDEHLQAVHERFRADRILARYVYFYWNEERVSPITPVTVRVSLDEMESSRVRTQQEEAETEKKNYTVYHVSGSGQGVKCVKIPSRTEDGYLVFKIAKETGLIAIVEGGVYIPESYDESAIYIRGGAIVGANAVREAAHAAGANANQAVKTRTEGNHYIYEGEGYYKAQFESLTADLQPGAQMNIRLADNRDFRNGNYRLTIRSNGNRQKFIIKVNYREVGSVIRTETDFSMASMTEDSMEKTLTLSPSDILTIEGEGGTHYGWVDYVDLTYVSSAASDGAKRTMTYRGTDLYEKQAEGYAAADLQPGDSLSFEPGRQAGFEEGNYQIAVTSNGNRTRLWVKVNGEMKGSIVRAAGSGFEKTDFTCNVMNHTMFLRGTDVITLEAPGSPEEGPWGWIETVQLIPAPQATGQPKAEYRYDGEDFYQASLYSPAADLQPETSITIPVSNDPDFVEGAYRLSVLSNGTREQFSVSVNGSPVGLIRRKATDYSDIDYSQDYLEALLNLKPGDTLTLTGQAGDFYGWVNYILLERAN